MLSKNIYKLTQTIMLIMGRKRAFFACLKGVQVGAKTTIGKRVSLLMPWTISIGERVSIESDVYIKITQESARCSIGSYTFIGRGVEFDVQEELSIGSHVLIAPGVFITDHNHSIEYTSRIDQQGCVGEIIRIADDVWIGANAVILPGVTIGEGAVVAAGAVVCKSIAPRTIVAGVPAEPVGQRN